MSSGSGGESDLLSIIVPAYNEERSVVGVIREIRLAQESLPCASELIVVDDGSSDRTGELLAEIEGVRSLRNPVNLGYGHSILRGLALARGNLIAIADADGTYPVGELRELYRMIQDGVDQSIGSRTGRQMRRMRVPRLIYRWLCGYVVGTHVPDANSGLRICRRQVLEEVRPDLSLGFSLTTSLTLAALMKGYVVAFSDIPYGKRVGRSHVRIRDVLRTAQYLVQLIAVYNPIKLFVPLVLLSALMALGSAIAGVAGAWSDGLLAAALLSGVSMTLLGLGIHTYVVSRVVGAQRR